MTESFSIEPYSGSQCKSKYNYTSLNWISITDAIPMYSDVYLGLSKFTEVPRSSACKFETV